MISSLININLSDINAAKLKKRPQQSKTSNVIGITAALIIIFIAFFYLYVTLRTKNVKILKNEYSGIEKPFIEVNKLIKLKNKLSLKAVALNKYKSGRINCADKWLELAKLTPEKIYITGIELLQNAKQADIQKMVIKARAENSVDESVILEFLDRLEKSAVFTNTFKEISLSSVYSDGDEKAFSIELQETKNKKE